MSDQPDIETSTWQSTTRTVDIDTPVEFELTIPASEQPQLHALDHTANGRGAKPLVFCSSRYNW